MNAFGMPLSDIATKWIEGFEKSREILRSKDVLLGPLDTEIAKTPYEVVYQEDRIKLKYYRPLGAKTLQTPLLIVYALINRDTMLDLQPGRSVIENFIKMGMDVYMIDWGYPTRKDRYLTIDDHVNGYMDNVVDFLRDRYGISKINLLGICMGGTFSTMYSALHPEKIKNLVITVAPTNFETDQGLLHLWTKEIDFERIVEAFGNVPGDLLNLYFLLLNPARLVIDKYVGFFENINNRDFIENFVRMEKWIFDSPDVPGETIRQFIGDCYQKNLLIQSKMEIGGTRVDLKNITMPLLNIYGKFDHLVPPGACDLLTSKVGTRDVEDICIDTGHIGMYVSSKAQKLFTPKIMEWLKQREGEPESQSESEPGLAKTESAEMAIKMETTPPDPAQPEPLPARHKVAASKTLPKKEKEDRQKAI